MSDRRQAVVTPDMIRRLVPEFNRTLSTATTRAVRPSWYDGPSPSDVNELDGLCHGCGYVDDCKCTPG